MVRRSIENKGCLSGHPNQGPLNLKSMEIISRPRVCCIGHKTRWSSGTLSKSWRPRCCEESRTTCAYDFLLGVTWIHSFSNSTAKVEILFANWDHFYPKTKEHDKKRALKFLHTCHKKAHQFWIDKKTVHKTQKMVNIEVVSNTTQEWLDYQRSRIIVDSSGTSAERCNKKELPRQWRSRETNWGPKEMMNLILNL